MSTTIQTIKILGRGDVRIEVPAIVTGNWAAHGALTHDLKPSDTAWTVTYVPLGREIGTGALGRCLPSVAMSVAAALSNRVPELTVDANGFIEGSFGDRVREVIREIETTTAAKALGANSDAPRDRLAQLRSAVANGQRLNEDGPLLRRALLALIDEALR